MGKHKKSTKSVPTSTPVPSQPTQVATPAPETPAPVATPPAAEMTDQAIFQSILAQVASLPDDLRAKAEAMLEKLKVDAARSNAAKQFATFNTELETELPKWLEDLAKKHNVSLAGRKITVAYPTDGKAPKPSHTPIGAKGAGNGHEGFPTTWGKATLVKEGKEIGYDSPSALATSLGLQIQGCRNMEDVFANPRKEGTKTELPKIYKVDAVRGDHFRVTIA